MSLGIKIKVISYVGICCDCFLFKNWTCMLGFLQRFSVFKLRIQICNPVFSCFNSISVTCSSAGRRNQVYRCFPSVFITRLDAIITDGFPRKSKVYSSSKKEKQDVIVVYKYAPNFRNKVFNRIPSKWSVSNASPPPQ